MKEKENAILIKNMVCQRCVMPVEHILNDLEIPFDKVSLGKVDLLKKPTDAELNEIQKELNHVGFEIVDPTKGPISSTHHHSCNH
jgi:copper chaperone CopZ